MNILWRYTHGLLDHWILNRWAKSETRRVHMQMILLQSQSAVFLVKRCIPSAHEDPWSCCYNVAVTWASSYHVMSLTKKNALWVVCTIGYDRFCADTGCTSFLIMTFYSEVKIGSQKSICTCVHVWVCTILWKRVHSTTKLARQASGACAQCVKDGLMQSEWCVCDCLKSKLRVFTLYRSELRQVSKSLRHLVTTREENVCQSTTYKWSEKRAIW